MKYIKSTSELVSYINEELMYKDILNEKSSLCLKNLQRVRGAIFIDILFLGVQPNLNFLRVHNSTLNRLQSEVCLLMRTENKFEDIEFVNTKIELVENEIIFTTTIESIYSETTTKTSNYQLNFFPMLDKVQGLKMSY